MKSLFFMTAVLFAVIAPLRADISGFNGIWAPVDANGNLINGFSVYGPGAGESFTAALSDNNTVLTMDFNNPLNTNESIFFQNYSGLLPGGTVSYNWSVQFLQSGSWLMETDVNTDLPANDSHGYFAAGTYSGPATLNYPGGSYFSYGNIGFGGDGAENAILTLTDFQYTGAATVTPEPAFNFLVAAIFLGLGFAAYRARRAAAR